MSATASLMPATLQRDDLVIFNQPIVPLRNSENRCDYSEILVRFRRDRNHPVPPANIFPALRDKGLLSLLDLWVVQRVLEHVRTLPPKESAPRFSINLSAQSMYSTAVCAYLRQCLDDKKKSSHGYLSFEINQSDAVEHYVPLRDTIGMLAPLGCRFGLSGFNGQGGSIQVLYNLPISFVKIDPVLTPPKHDGNGVRAKLHTLTEYCHEAGVYTVAERVESREGLAWLAHAGVDYAQGYAIASPKPLN